MRLRKQASKLLGWAYSSQFRSSSFSEAQHCWPPAAAASGEDADELQCQLNQSPWDAFESPHRTNSQEEIAKSNEEEEVETAGLVKSRHKSKEEMEEDDDDGLEQNANDKKEQNDVTRPSMNTRESTEAEVEIAGMKCKKTDGKGWHCKRPAQIPHSLCSYHLTQVRSYRSRFEEQIYGNGRRENSNRRLKSAAAVETGGVASSYYYYSVIGPWWGKRRGPIDVKESSESDISPGEHDENAENGGIADDADEEDDDGASRCNRVTYKRKRPLKKKRGRKPVKARSLKSLL